MGETRTDKIFIVFFLKLSKDFINVENIYYVIQFKENIEFAMRI